MSASLTILCAMLALCLHPAISYYEGFGQPKDGYEAFPEYNASRYRVPGMMHSWANGVEYCRRDGNGSHLMVINSDKEAEVFVKLMEKLGTPIKQGWVGIGAASSQGPWMTLRGDPVSESGYNEWDNGNYLNGSWLVADKRYEYVENFLEEYRCAVANPVGKFIPTNCHSRHIIVCEKPKA